MKYIDEIYKEALKAYKNKEIPIGAIVVKNNKIIGRGYNKKEKLKDVTKHAEIIAIQKASKKIKNWRLNDCDLYVTLEPCTMCRGAIMQSRIRNVYYLISAEDNNTTALINDRTCYNQLEDEVNSLSLLQQFFKEKRK